MGRGVSVRLLAGAVLLLVLVLALSGVGVTGKRAPAHYRRYAVHVATRRAERAQGGGGEPTGGEARTLEDKVEMTRWDGRKFACHVAAAPPLMPRDDGIARDGVPTGALYSHHPAWSLHTHADPLPALPAVTAAEQALWSLEGRCFFLPSMAGGYWTVEYCYGQHVKHVHRNADGSVVELLLGRFDAAHSTRRIERNNATHEPHVTTPLVHGTACDGIGARRVDVHLRCASHGRKHRIVALREQTSCVYELDFETPLLCGVDAFARGDDPALPIACEPLEDEPTAPLEELEERMGAPAGVWSVAETDTLERRAVVRLSDLPLQELVWERRAAGQGDTPPSAESVRAMLHAMRFFLVDTMDADSHAMTSGSAMLPLDTASDAGAICMGSSAQGAHAMVYDVSALASEGVMHGEYYDSVVGFVGRETATRQSTGLGPSWVEGMPPTLDGTYELVGYAHHSPAQVYRGTLRVRQRDEHGRLFSLAWILHHDGTAMPTTFTGLGQLMGDGATHMCVAWSRSGHWFVRNQVWLSAQERGSYDAHAYAATLDEHTLLVSPTGQGEGREDAPVGAYAVHTLSTATREKTLAYKLDVHAVTGGGATSHEHNVYSIDVHDAEGALLHHTTGVYDRKGNDMCVVAPGTSALLLQVDAKRGVLYGDWHDLSTQGHGHESAQRVGDAPEGAESSVEGAWEVSGKQFTRERVLQYTAQLRIVRRGRSQTYMLEWVLQQPSGPLVVRGIGVRYGERMCVSWSGDLYSVGVLRLALSKRKRGQMAMVRVGTDARAATWMDAEGTPDVMERLAAGKAAHRLPTEGVWSIEREGDTVGTLELTSLDIPGKRGDFYRVAYHMGEETVSGWGIFTADGVLCGSKGTFKSPVVLYSILGDGVLYGTWVQGDLLSHGVEVARSDGLDGSLEGEYSIEGSEHQRELYEGMMTVRKSTHAAGKYVVQYHMGPAGGVKDASFTGSGVRNEAYFCLGWGLQQWPVEGSLFQLEERGGERVAVLLEAEQEAAPNYFDDGDEWE